jgi:outer membrane protein TolC
VWTGGRRAASSARVTAQLQQLIAQRDARRTEIELAVRDAESDVALANAENELAAKVKAAAAEGLRIAEQLAQEGRGEANDVLLAQVALADADDDVANARAHVVAARARLMIMLK